LEADDIEWFADRDDLELTPEHYGERGIRRFIAITPELMKLLGFYLAEGSCSDRNGVRLSIGKSNVRFSEEMADGFTRVFGLAPQSYPIDRGAGELKLVNRVAALAWQHLFGFRAVDSISKRIPDLVFNVPEPLRLAFLRGYLLGDGCATAGRVVFSTSSRDIASGVAYLLASFGAVPQIHEIAADRVSRHCGEHAFKTTHRHWQIAVAAVEDLTRLRPVWCDHSGASTVEQRIADADYPGRRRFDVIDGDLLALPIVSITPVEASNGNVYDFSVEGDENFICGFGGIAAKNTDADVDGSHIRT